MTHFLEAFLLGNGAILSNVCLLPLYPGLIAFLVGNAENKRARRLAALLGLLVLAGILSMMMLIGFVLFLLQKSFASLLSWFLPLSYGLIIILGVFLLLGFNPFMRLSSLQTPVIRNPSLAAYVYGLLLGPMTLPCTGPIIVGAFILGAGSAFDLLDKLSYFLVFGLGFGWPLVLLPIIALPWQRRVTSWLSHHHKLISSISGLALVAIGLYGFWTERGQIF